MKDQINNGSDTRPALWVLFFTLVGFGLRVQQLSFQPLWGDEGWSFYFAMQPAPQLLALTAVDIHPPLYYLLLKWWLFLFGVGPEVARLFSALVGTLLIPVVAVIGRRLDSWRTGGFAAMIVAVMPMAVYYGQEVRMYGLVTLLAALSTYFLIRWQDGRRFQLGYILSASAALYTMYYAAFVVLAQFISGLFSTRRGKHLLTPFIIVGLLYLPWITYAGVQLVAYVSNKRDVEAYASLGLLNFVADHLVAFSVGHLPAGLLPVIWIATPAILLATIGLVVAAARPSTRLLVYYLFVPLLAGYAVNLAVPFTPRFFERTLLLAAPAYWLLIALGLAWCWRKQRLLGSVTVVLVLVPAVTSLLVFYFTPRYSDEDYRPLLRQVAARATSADTLLASYQWQMGFYHAYLASPRPQVFAVPEWGAGWSAQAGNAARLSSDLNTILEQSPRLWFPAYQSGGHIWEDEAEAAIARQGYPAVQQWYSPQTKLTLAGAKRLPMQSIGTANFADWLLLLGASVGGDRFQAGRDIIPVDLTWRMGGDLDDEHRVSLRLADVQGRTWATRDIPGGPERQPINQLPVGVSQNVQVGLLTPAGAPPGSYQLLLSVRRVADDRPVDLVDSTGQPAGAELLLAEATLVQPEPPVGAAALPVQIKAGAAFENMVRLVGYSLGSDTIQVGTGLPLTLFWEALVDAPDIAAVVIELLNQDGQVVMSHPQPVGWPPDEWTTGTLLRDPLSITVPPNLAPGQYKLRVALTSSDEKPLQVAGDDVVYLQEVAVTDRERVFDPPAPDFGLDANFGNQVRLVGVDLPETEVTSGAVLPLTLYWQALGTADKSWKVFVHLIDSEARIIAQQDQIPGSGKFPSTGWVSGEYLTDPYDLFLPPDAPSGKYLLRIGLYNPNDSIRLPVVVDNLDVNDHIILESWPISVE